LERGTGSEERAEGLLGYRGKKNKHKKKKKKKKEKNHSLVSPPFHHPISGKVKGVLSLSGRALRHGQV